MTTENSTNTEEAKLDIPLDISKVNRSEVARQTGADLAHISRIFNRKGNPSLPLAVKIARILHVTVEDLCDALDIGGVEHLDSNTKADVGAGRKSDSESDKEILDKGATAVV